MIHLDYQIYKLYWDLTHGNYRCGICGERFYATVKKPISPQKLQHAYNKMIEIHRRRKHPRINIWSAKVLDNRGVMIELEEVK
jgi:hypothetical protein